MEERKDRRKEINEEIERAQELLGSGASLPQQELIEKEIEKLKQELASLESVTQATAKASLGTGDTHASAKLSVSSEQIKAKQDFLKALNANGNLNRVKKISAESLAEIMIANPHHASTILGNEKCARKLAKSPWIIERLMQHEKLRESVVRSTIIEKIKVPQWKTYLAVWLDPSKLSRWDHKANLATMDKALLEKLIDKDPKTRQALRAALPAINKDLVVNLRSKMDEAVENEVEKVFQGPNRNEVMREKLQRDPAFKQELLEHPGNPNGVKNIFPELKQASRRIEPARQTPRAMTEVDKSETFESAMEKLDAITAKNSQAQTNVTTADLSVKEIVDFSLRNHALKEVVLAEVDGDKFPVGKQQMRKFIEALNGALEQKGDEELIFAEDDEFEEQPIGQKTDPGLTYERYNQIREAIFGKGSAHFRIPRENFDESRFNINEDVAFPKQEQSAMVEVPTIPLRKSSVYQRLTTNPAIARVRGDTVSASLPNLPRASTRLSITSPKIEKTELTDIVNRLIDTPKLAETYFRKSVSLSESSPSLSRRSSRAEPNYREALAKNPELVEKIILSGKPELLAAIKNNDLLNSSHFAKNKASQERLKIIFKMVEGFNKIKNDDFRELCILQFGKALQNFNGDISDHHANVDEFVNALNQFPNLKPEDYEDELKTFSLDKLFGHKAKAGPNVPVPESRDVQGDESHEALKAILNKEINSGSPPLIDPEQRAALRQLNIRPNIIEGDKKAIKIAVIKKGTDQHVAYLTRKFTDRADRYLHQLDRGQLLNDRQLHNVREMQKYVPGILIKSAGKPEMVQRAEALQQRLAAIGERQEFHAELDRRHIEEEVQKRQADEQVIKFLKGANKKEEIRDKRKSGFIDIDENAVSVDAEKPKASAAKVENNIHSQKVSSEAFLQKMGMQNTLSYFENNLSHIELEIDKLKNTQLRTALKDVINDNKADLGWIKEYLLERIERVQGVIEADAEKARLATIPRESKPVEKVEVIQPRRYRAETSTEDEQYIQKRKAELNSPQRPIVEQKAQSPAQPVVEKRLEPKQPQPVVEKRLGPKQAREERKSQEFIFDSSVKEDVKAAKESAKNPMLAKEGESNADRRKRLFAEREAVEAKLNKVEQDAVDKEDPYKDFDFVNHDAYAEELAAEKITKMNAYEACYDALLKIENREVKGLMLKQFDATFKAGLSHHLPVDKMKDFVGDVNKVLKSSGGLNHPKLVELLHKHFNDGKGGLNPPSVISLFDVEKSKFPQNGKGQFMGPASPAQKSSMQIQPDMRRDSSSGSRMKH